MTTTTANPTHRHTTILLLQILLVSVLLLAAPAPASASLGAIGSFGASGPGALVEAHGIAVAANTGDVYVADRGGERVIEYSEAGTFILMFGREVNETKTSEFNEPGNPHQITEAEENLCTLASGNTCKVGVPGTGPGQFDGATGVAVDPISGDVYVNAEGNTANYTEPDNRVERFTPSGQYLSEIVGGENGAPEFSLPTYGNGLAVDTEGNLYVVSSQPTPSGAVQAVFKFDSSGMYTGQSFVPPEIGGPRSGGSKWPWSFPKDVAVDANGTVYVSQEANPAVEFSPSGEALETLGCTGSMGKGLTVNLFNGEVFADSSPAESSVPADICQYETASVQVGEFPAAPPTHSSGPALQELAYGTSAGRLYELYVGEVVMYGTFPLPVQAEPWVSREEWSDVGLTSVELAGRVTPNSLDSTYYFQYATSPDFTGAVSLPSSPVDVGAGFLPVDVAGEPTGLLPSTTYYYRVVAHNAYGGGATVDGPTQTFTTLAPLPSAITGEAGEVSYDEASIDGTVTPGSTGSASETIWCFQYGATEGPGYNLGFLPGTPAGDAGQGTSAVPVSVRLTRLEAGTTYRYRLVAVNSLGLRQSSTACGTAGGRETDGGEGTFTTAASAPGPLAESGPAATISQNAATLTGAVDPRGTRTIYYFQIGTDTTYGVDLFGDAGAGGEPESVSVLASSLQPGATYHYRLVASSAYGTSYGADESFTTPAFPSSVLAAPLAPPLIGTPDIAFPAEAKGGATIKKTTPKCKKGKKLSHGKCVKSKTKKKAKKASRSRKER